MSPDRPEYCVFLPDMQESLGVSILGEDMLVEMVSTYIFIYLCFISYVFLIY